MTELEHELRPPVSDEEWRAFHAIRRRVLFENRGKGETYIENHPDDSKPGNHPLILLYRGDVIGVMRLDVSEMVGWLRRVAIREDLQRLGQAQGCHELRTNAAVEAVGFYERCGYTQDHKASSPPNSVRMQKRLT